MSTPKPHTFFVIFALWLMVFSASSQVIIIAPILPRIGEALHIPEAIQGTLVMAYAVMLSLFALITGPISDKIGRRRILLVGCGFMATALLLHSTAGSFLSLFSMRALAGAAGGTLSGAAVSYVGDYFPYERRGWANGWVMSGLAFGQIVGIPLGIFLADLGNFRWPFLLFAFTMGLATVLVWRFVPQPPVRRNPDPLTIRRALKNYKTLLQKDETASAVLVYFLMFFSIGLFLVYLPTWLERHLGVSGTQIASMFFVGGIANVLTGPLAGRVSDTVGRKPVIITSCLGLGVIILLTTFVITNMWFAYLIFAVAMVMVAMRLSPLQSLLTALVPDEQRGILMSLVVAVGQVGIGISGAVAGPIYTEFGFFYNTLWGAFFIFMMAFFVWRSLPEPKIATVY